MPLSIKILIALLLFLAVGAIAGGSVILSDPSGAFAQMSPRDLAGSPFPNFLIPGLVLLIVLGFGSALAALLLWKLPGRISWTFAAGISTALLIWIAVQVAIIGYRGWLQPFYASLGVAMLTLLTTRAARAYGRAPAPGHPVSK
jgi:hypothetical protein